MTNKDLIKQYCNTGIKIPYSQFDKLSTSLQKTYLRMRFIACKDDLEELVPYEFNLLPQEKILEILKLCADNRIDLNWFIFQNLTSENRKIYLDFCLESRGASNMSYYIKFMTLEQQKKYIDEFISNDILPGSSFFENLDKDNLRYYYQKKMIMNIDQDSIFDFDEINNLRRFPDLLEIYLKRILKSRPNDLIGIEKVCAKQLNLI